MSDLIVACYDDPFKADVVRTALIKREEPFRADMEDAVVVVHDAAGRLLYRRLYEVTEKGSARETTDSLLLGLILKSPAFSLGRRAVSAGPADASAGTVAGALAFVGVDESFTASLGRMLVPGASALFVRTRNSSAHRLIDALAEFDGQIMQTTLSDERERTVRETCNVMMAEFESS